MKGPQHWLEPALSISLVRKTLRLAPPRPLLETGQHRLIMTIDPGDRGRGGLDGAQCLVNQDLVREGGGRCRAVDVQIKIPIGVYSLFIGDKRLVCLVKGHKLLEDFLLLLKVSLDGLQDWLGVCGLLDHVTLLLIFLHQRLDGGGVGCGDCCHRCWSRCCGGCRCWCCGGCGGHWWWFCPDKWWGWPFLESFFFPILIWKLGLLKFGRFSGNRCGKRVNIIVLINFDQWLDGCCFIIWCCCCCCLFLSS